MSREIKFRAWNENIKWMSKPFTFGQVLNFHDQIIKSLSSEEVLMQYTGLNDKNGKEIYFGDVLATSNDNSQPFTEYDIWSKEEYGYTVVLENKEELGICYSNWSVENDLMDNGYYEKNSVYSLGFVEVIGDIYSNPELINQ